MKVTTKTLELSIVSSNMEHRRSTAAVTKDRDYVVNTFKPDIWGAQECESYNSILAGAKGYNLAMPKNPTGTQRQNPILYNEATMRKISAGSVLVHKGQAHAYPDRMVNWAHFRDRTDGNSIWYFNTHLNSHIEVAGSPRVLPRVALSTAHLRKLASMVSEHTVGQNLVFWGGDFNIDEDADNRVNWGGFANAIFHKAGLVSVYDELKTPASFDTHDKRKIDVIGSHKADTRVSAKSVQRSGVMGSDHRFIKAVFVINRLHPGKAASDPYTTSTPVDPGEEAADPSLDPSGLPTEYVPSTPNPGPKDPGIVDDHSDCCGDWVQ